MYYESISFQWKEWIEIHNSIQKNIYYWFIDMKELELVKMKKKIILWFMIWYIIEVESFVVD